MRVILWPNCVDYIISDVSSKKLSKMRWEMKDERDKRKIELKAINYVSNRWDVANS